MSILKYETVYLSSLAPNSAYLKLYHQSILYTLKSLNIDYSDFNEWYCSKVIPGIKKGEREIITYLADDFIAAICILKKTSTEKKISTIRVLPKFQRLGFGKQIILDSFKFLDTDKPLITVPASKIHLFNNLFRRYDFKLSTIENAYMRNRNDEYIFNL